MLELSLHVLDMINNSIRAGASLIGVTVCEDVIRNRFSIEITDNGSGMEEALVQTVTDPFCTTRTTRKVGMGLSLFKAAAEAAGGQLSISSEKGVGTRVIAEFEHNHINRQPMGNISETLLSVLAGNPSIDICYRHTVNQDAYTFDTREVRSVLGNLDLSNPNVLLLLSAHIKESLEKMQTA